MMPMPGSAPGGMPPGAAPGGPPPGGTGAATVPGQMHGNQAQAMAKLEMGMKALTEALQGLPMGSPQHNAVLKALGDIGKHMPQGGSAAGDQQAQIQQLAMLAREMKAQPGQQQALAGMMGGGAAPPGAGAPPPPTPPMGG